MRFEVTGTCYPEAPALSGYIGGVQEIEFKQQVAKQKEKLTAMSDSILLEIQTLVIFSIFGFTPKKRGEKTLKEKYLEALGYGWKTVKEVCLQVHPSVNVLSSSREKERAMRSASMFLMRLSKPDEKLVQRRWGKNGWEYHILLKGLKRLFFYMGERDRTARKRELHELMEKIVKANNEIVPEIEQMRACNTEAIKKLENTALAEYLHRIYGGIVRTLTLQINACQRAITENDGDLQINVLVHGRVAAPRRARGFYDRCIGNVAGRTKAIERPDSACLARAGFSSWIWLWC